MSTFGCDVSQTFFDLDDVTYLKDTIQVAWRPSFDWQQSAAAISLDQRGQMVLEGRHGDGCHLHHSSSRVQAGFSVFPVNIEFEAPDVTGSFSGHTVPTHTHTDLHPWLHTRMPDFPPARSSKQMTFFLVLCIEILAQCLLQVQMLPCFLWNTN